MGIAVIPDDWTSGYTELCVKWPDSPDWLAVLRGQLTAPNEAEFWDKFTGDVDDPKTAIYPTFDQNLHLEECMIIPSGTILPYGGDDAPAGFFLCDGTEFVRLDEAALYAIIGTKYGVGNGSTTANLPDLRGRVPVGLDVGWGDFDELGKTGGEIEHTLTEAEMPIHSHTQNAHTHTQNAHTHTQNAHTHTQDAHAHDFNSTDGDALTVYGGVVTTLGLKRTSIVYAATALNQNSTPTNQNSTPTNQNTGGDGSHQNMSPFQIVNFIIRR